MEPTITCPNCSTEIKLNESLAGPLVEKTRQEFEAKLAQQKSEIQKRENDVRTQKEAVEKAKQTLEAQVAEKLTLERKNIVKEEAEKAHKLVAAAPLPEC